MVPLTFICSGSLASVSLYQPFQAKARHAQRLPEAWSLNAESSAELGMLVTSGYTHFPCPYSRVRFHL